MEKGTRFKGIASCWVVVVQAAREGWKADCHRLFHREPDSTYFDLPPSNHTGGNEVSSRAEVTMDVFQMRSMNDSVMVSVLRRHKWELHQTQTCLPRHGLGAPGEELGCLLVHKPNTNTTGAALLSFVQGLVTRNRRQRCRIAAGWYGVL